MHYRTLSLSLISVHYNLKFSNNDLAVLSVERHPCYYDTTAYIFQKTISKKFNNVWATDFLQIVFMIITFINIDYVFLKKLFRVIIQKLGWWLEIIKF